MVVALGVTLTGEKVVLGCVETSTENAKVCTQFLQGLKTRGLRNEDGLLVIIDGGKGCTPAWSRPSAALPRSNAVRGSAPEFQLRAALTREAELVFCYRGKLR
jgi:Transposase, Mutator family